MSTLAAASAAAPPGARGLATTHSERSSRVIVVRNRKALWAFACAAGAIAFLVAGAAATNDADTVTVYSYASIPAAFLTAVIALSLARRARFDFQRSLGRVGGNGIAIVSKSLGLLALLLSLTGALAIGVFLVLRIVA